MKTFDKGIFKLYRSMLKEEIEREEPYLMPIQIKT